MIVTRPLQVIAGAAAGTSACAAELETVLRMLGLIPDPPTVRAPVRRVGRTGRMAPLTAGPEPAHQGVTPGLLAWMVTNGWARPAPQNGDNDQLPPVPLSGQNTEDSSWVHR